MQNKWIKRSGFIVGCLFYSLGTYLILGISGETNPTWMNAHPIILLSRMIVGIPFYYMLVMIVFDLVILMITLNRIMKLRGVISVEPSHSDNAGGLGVIGGFIANLGYLGFAFMVVIGSLWWQSWLNQSIGNKSWLVASFIVSIAYLLIVPFLFFIPLYSTHKAMQAFQQERIQKLSDQIERVSQDLFDNCGNIKKVGQDVDQLKVLEEAILIVSRYRTWPFRPPDLRKYYTLVASPVGAILLGVTGNWFYDRIF